MTTSAPLKLSEANDEMYSPEGVKSKFSAIGYLTMNSTVVCFESSAAEEGGKLLHSAVGIDVGYDFALPPLTLLEVVDEQEGPFEYMPGSET